MSAYKSLTCSFKDKDALIASLKELGYKPTVNETKQNLRGYRNDIREQTAEIIVPRNQISSASNDLGFSYDEAKKEYIMICSEYDLHQGVGDKIKQSYAITAVKLALKKNRFTVKSEVHEKNGNVILTAGKII